MCFIYHNLVDACTLHNLNESTWERERDNEVFMYYVDKFDVIFCAVDHYSRNTYIYIISLEETDNGIVNFPDHRFLRHTNYIRQISTEILLCTMNALTIPIYNPLFCNVSPYLNCLFNESIPSHNNIINY